MSQRFQICLIEIKGRQLCQELPSPRKHQLQAGATAQPCCTSPSPSCRQVPHTPSAAGLQRNKSEPCLDFISFAYTRTINLLFASRCIQRSQETEGGSLVATTSSLTAMELNTHLNHVCCSSLLLRGCTSLYYSND